MKLYETFGVAMAAAFGVLLVACIFGDLQQVVRVCYVAGPLAVMVIFSVVIDV